MPRFKMLRRLLRAYRHRAKWGPTDKLLLLAWVLIVAAAAWAASDYYFTGRWGDLWH